MNYGVNGRGCILASRQRVYTWTEMQINLTINLTNRQGGRERERVCVYVCSYIRMHVLAHMLYNVILIRSLILPVLKISHQTAVNNTLFRLLMMLYKNRGGALMHWSDLLLFFWSPSLSCLSSPAAPLSSAGRVSPC